MGEFTLSGLMDYVYVFLIGGAICLIGQLLLSYTNMTSARILVLFVSLGAILTAVGLYQPIVEIGKAGATVPLTGFGYALAKGAIEGVRLNGIWGAFTGGITATAGGVSAAILFGYIFALICKPKTKK